MKDSTTNTHNTNSQQQDRNLRMGPNDQSRNPQDPNKTGARPTDPNKLKNPNQPNKPADKNINKGKF